MRFDVLTLFPEIFQGYLTQSLLKLAIQTRAWWRSISGTSATGPTGKHKSVDDRPFGGGPGMVLMPEPVFAAVEAVQAKARRAGQLVLLTPAGERLTQTAGEGACRSTSGCCCCAAAMRALTSASGWA